MTKLSEDQDVLLRDMYALCTSLQSNAEKLCEVISGAVDESKYNIIIDSHILRWATNIRESTKYIGSIHNKLTETTKLKGDKA